MLTITSDLHTHTIASHGRGTIAENVEKAVALGLEKIAITDHGPAHLFGIGIKDPQVLLAQKKEASALQKRWPQIEILIGVEANIISPEGNLDVPQEILAQLDLVLVGLHRGVRPLSATAFRRFVLPNWLARIPRHRPKAREINTQALINCLDRYQVDFITHPGFNLAVDTPILAKAAKEQGVALELSGGHGAQVEFVEAALARGVEFVITSDAHRPEGVGNFQKALALVEQFRIPKGRIRNSR